MIIKQRKLNGTYEITLEPRGDHRGYFMRVYDDKILAEYGIHRNWVQENQSLSAKQGVIRGLHMQMGEFAETKLVRVIRGKILDVFVDVRPDSPTFGQWDSIELSEENNKMVLVPGGFAHGFCTLSENCIVSYKVDNYYSPQNECGLMWNDKELCIEWPVEDPILSEKDQKNMTFSEFKEKYCESKTF